MPTMPNRIATSILPPFLLRVANRMRNPPNTHSGPYPDWRSARDAASGYADPAILDRVLAATREVLEGRAAYEQDGVAFPEPARPDPALAGLLLASALAGGPLSVVDFGGALGSHYLRWRRYLSLLPSLAWHVVEQPAHVAAGTALFSGRGHPVVFREALPGRDQSGACALLASGVLQYLEQPMEALSGFLALAPRVIILDRLPLAADGVSRILVQHLSRRLYPGSYPLWTLARADVAERLLGRYRLLEEFTCPDAPVLRGAIRADYGGSIWLRRDPA